MADVLVGETRFNVVRMGSGPETIVLIHGMVVDNLSSWFMSVAPSLSKTYSLVLYDLRGHGMSERPSNGYRMVDHVEDLRALLDTLDLAGQPVTLAGNSSGGLIGLMFALRYPERVKRLIMIEGHSGRDNFSDEMTETLNMDQGRLNQEAKAVLDRIMEQMRTKAPDDKEAAGIVAAMEHTTKNKRRNPLLAKMERLVNETTFAEDMLKFTPVTDEELTHLNVPTLAIYGSESELLIDGQRLEKFVPDCQLRVLPDIAHFVLMNETAAINSYITEWLAATA